MESTDRAGQIETLTLLAQNQQRDIQLQAEKIRLGAEELAALRQRLATEQALQKEMEDAKVKMLLQLRRTQSEASLAARLLELSATLPIPNPVIWTQIPSLPPDAAPSEPVHSHIETADYGSNLVRIAGWGFSKSVDAAPANPPCLLLAGASASWVLRGTRIDRPDVAAAFPAKEPAATARRQSGFIFEFHPNQLPVPTPWTFRVLCGQTAGTPVLTPAFSRP